MKTWTHPLLVGFGNFQINSGQENSGYERINFTASNCGYSGIVTAIEGAQDFKLCDQILGCVTTTPYPLNANGRTVIPEFPDGLCS